MIEETKRKNHQTKKQKNSDIYHGKSINEIDYQGRIQDFKIEGAQNMTYFCVHVTSAKREKCLPQKGCSYLSE